MNKTIFTPAVEKTWLFALLLVIFSALYVLPFITAVPVLGDIIKGGFFASFIFIAIYMRDASYAFEGDERVALKDVALGFGLMVTGLIAETYGTPLTPTAIIWDLVFGVLFLIGGLKVMGGFGKLNKSANFPDTKTAGTLKLAGIFFIVAAALGILFAFLSIFWIFFQIFVLVAAIIFLVGMGKIKAL